MRFRTLLLALALGCGMTLAPGSTANAATKKVKVQKNRGYNTNRANRVKPRKAKNFKPKPVKTRRVKH